MISGLHVTVHNMEFCELGNSKGISGLPKMHCIFVHAQKLPIFSGILSTTKSFGFCVQKMLRIFMYQKPLKHYTNKIMPPIYDGWFLTENKKLWRWLR